MHPARPSLPILSSWGSTSLMSLCMPHTPNHLCRHPQMQACPFCMHLARPGPLSCGSAHIQRTRPSLPLWTKPTAPLSPFPHTQARLCHASMPLHLSSVAKLGKFGPGPIGTWSGLDQTPQSRSWSGIFPKTLDCLVSGLGIPYCPRPSQTRSGPGLHKLYKQYANILFLIH